MKKEYSPYHPYGWWSVPWPLPALDNGPLSELIPWGRAKVAKIDKFPELKGRRGALLKWPDLEKKGHKMIVDIGHHKGYIEGADVQIIKRIPLSPIEDTPYLTRPMAKGNDLWGNKEFTSSARKFLKKLAPAYIFKT